MSSRNTILVKFFSLFFVVSMVLPLSFTPAKVLASQVDNGGQCVTEIVSDTETKVNGSASVATYDGHIDWTASIPGATWIWSSYHVEDPLVVTTKTFTREFNLASGSIADSILTIAADNNFKVFVNGTEVASDLSGDNFFDVKTYNISSNLNSGANTISFEITNITHPQALTPETNPAGLLYSLKVVQDGSCSGGGNPPAQDPTVSLTATPSVITLGETSTLAWTSTNTDSCSSTWLSGMGTAGNTSVSPATTTEYVVSCVGNSKTVYATTTVTVNTNTGGPGPSCTIDIVSDTTNTVNGTVTPSVATYKDNPRWTASIPGATWIWKTFLVENPTQDEYYTFLKQFNVTDVSKVKTASLVVAADNSYTVNLNGTEFAADATETNYFDEDKDTYDVKSRLQNGNNALYFVVKNWGIADSVAESNPAGLLYKLTITVEGSDCGGGNGGNPTPSVSLNANPSTINTGATSTLAWVSTNTNYCAASWTTATSTSGSMVVSPATTTDYAISCGGNYGTTTATTTVTVNTNNGGGTPTPSVTLTANPSSIAPGATSTLVWNSSNTNFCTAAWTTATSTSGSFDVTPGVTTDYSISCGGNYGTTTATTTVTVTTGGGNGGNPTPSITLTANPQSITLGASSTINWTSTNTNYCTAAWTTATSTSGSFEVAPTSTTDYSISCGGNYGTTTATTTVTVNTDNNGGGNGGGGNGGGSNGGGGSNIGGRRRDISNLLAPQGEVLGATSCSYLRDHLKMGWNNDEVEMLKLKSFLNVFEKESLSLDSNFDQATFDAVSRFQNKYFAEVLAPWGHTAPTGFVYITTKKKINEIYCNTVLSLSSSEAAEIESFRSMIEGNYFGAANSDILSGLYDGEDTVVGGVATSDDDTNNTSTTSTSTSPVSVVKNMAVSLFSIPDGLQDFFSNSRNVIFAIIALIVLSVVARMFLYSGDDNEELVSESSNVASSNTGAASTMKDDSPVIILPGENTENKA